MLRILKQSSSNREGILKSTLNVITDPNGMEQSFHNRKQTTSTLGEETNSLRNSSEYIKGGLSAARAMPIKKNVHKL
jgi:hypothetical protein